MPPAIPDRAGPLERGTADLMGPAPPQREQITRWKVRAKEKRQPGGPGGSPESGPARLAREGLHNPASLDCEPRRDVSRQKWRPATIEASSGR